MAHDKYGDDDYKVDVEIGDKTVTFNTYEDSEGNTKGVWNVFDEDGDREGHVTFHDEDNIHVHEPDDDYFEHKDEDGNWHKSDEYGEDE